MDLMTIVDSLFENHDCFHDVIVETTGMSHDVEKLKELFLTLPIPMQCIAFEHGLSDTVFRDEVYVHITQELTKNRQA